MNHKLRRLLVVAAGTALVLGAVGIATRETESSKREVISPAKMLLMFENLNTAIVASDADFKIIYANEKCRQMFKEWGAENFVGNDMAECHTADSMEKIRTMYKEFKEKREHLHYYLMDLPEVGVLTIVSVPYYDGDDFAGVVEFIFEGSLG